MQQQQISQDSGRQVDMTIGRIVSVTGARAIVLLDGKLDPSGRKTMHRPEMGTLLAIDTNVSVVLAIVSALSVPVPAQREGDNEIWIAELGLVGELWFGKDRLSHKFNRGVTVYPALGDRVRIASKDELELAFCGDKKQAVRVGCIRQDSTIPAMVKVDDLLGKHFAILGTTGTGKSCTTALILRAILKENPAAHIVLLDPHNEYATAFPEWAEVVNPRNMQLPFWLLTFEEVIEVLVGSAERKPEIEILQELIPLAKSRYNTGRSKDGNVRRGLDSGRYTVDTPVPYRISDIMHMIDERMGKLENRRDLAPYRSLKQRIEMITQDGRYAFMFGSLTVYDGMTQVLSRIFRVPVNGRPITILELTGIPTEIVNVVVSVLCRMCFDFALWSEGQVPVTLVCEEAHRYVPANPNTGFEPCKRAIAKIAKEGRKYGASLCIVTQRPAEIDPTILSQCNTVFALRMSNDRDQEIVTSAISDTGSGLLEFLSALGQREAIAFGDGVTLPVRIKFDELPKADMPRSSTAHFSERWQKSVGDEGFLEQIVDRWRRSATDTFDSKSGLVDADGNDDGYVGTGVDNEQDGYQPNPNQSYAAAQNSGHSNGVGQDAAQRAQLRPARHAQLDRNADVNAASTVRASLRRTKDSGANPAGATLRRNNAPQEEAPVDPTQGQALKSLRDRLMQRQR
ncbi:MAG: ATP-binding protein [Hyphomicrobiaceae bacterium]|nr:ATP-binding protein [Hyphomicrobiaceae bacterium]